MKINDIIREKRLAKGLTQEQIANYLGVSIPAVNKWERGISYPDIVLLPALARLLDTDLNTLLSFQDNLSKEEITLFLNKVSEVIDKSGFEAGYVLATEKLKEFPTCDLLIINLAMLLDGALILCKNQRLNEKYHDKIEELYYRAAQSDDIAIKEQALVHLISKAMENQDYNHAQEMLNTISNKNPINKEQIQANIYIAQQETKKAAKLIEEKLLATTYEIHTSLMTLMEIALKENRLDDAKYIADVDKQAAKLFDLWQYNFYLAHFQLYSTTKNKAELLKILLLMLESLTKKWDINSSPLYQHIKTKEVDNTFTTKLQKTILQSIGTDKNTEFLKDTPELKELIRKIDLK